MSLTGRKPYQKTPTEPDPERLADLHDVPCCICLEFDLAQRSLTQAHHPIHERGGNRRAADGKCIPLCEGHHQGDFDKSKVALHRHPDEWKRLYGNDFDWIAWTDRYLKRHRSNKI